MGCVVGLEQCENVAGGQFVSNTSSTFDWSSVLMLYHNELKTR